jgi:cell division initiation protein
MRISPIDIQQQQFKSRPFGYEKAGVDRFLESLAEELERLMRQNHDLQEELAHTNAALTEMRDREGTLKETLVTTQKITEELKATARREVDVLMAEAEIKAERLMRNAEERRVQLIEEIQETKRQKIDFEVSLKGLLEKHIRMLDLNAVGIEQQDADARLLEEPLPFINASGPESEEVAPQAADHSEGLVEDAEFTEPNQVDSAAENSTAEPSPENNAPELSFDFDPNEINGERDLLK